MKILVETGGHIEELAHKPFEDEVKLELLPAQHPDLVLAGTSDDEDRYIWTTGLEVEVPSGSIVLPKSRNPPLEQGFLWWALLGSNQ